MKNTKRTAADHDRHPLWTNGQCDICVNFDDGCDGCEHGRKENAMDEQTSYACLACGTRVSAADSLTDYETAACIARTDGRKGSARQRVRCDSCGGTGRARSRLSGFSEPVACYCQQCNGNGRVSVASDARRICKPCAREILPMRYRHFINRPLFIIS